MDARLRRPRRDRRPLYVTAGIVALLVLAEAAMLATWTSIAQHPDRPFDWIGFVGVLIGLGLADVFFTVYIWARVADR